jgi:PAS domain S-box-containing protein
MFGFDKNEILQSSPWDVSPEKQPDGSDSRKKSIEYLNLAIQGKPQHFEWQHKKSDGRLFDAEINLSPIRLEHKIFVQGIVRDITERKQVENLLRKLSSAVEQSPASVVITNTDGNIEYVNTKFTEITGYKFEEVRGKNPRFLKSGETPPEEYERLWKTITGGSEWSGLFHNKKKDGTLFWESASISPILDENRKIINFLAVKEDITEKKLKDEILLQSLKEKEIMLKEIHHRVKNNLQIITSLLKLQSSYITDPVATEYFNISQNRVKSMALIHQQLYRSSDLGRICFEDYLFQLVNHLCRAYGTNTDRITVKIDAKGLYFGIDTAIPCGLLINELVSNSLKHAFPGERTGFVKIKMFEKNGEYVLEVTDNGIGLPDSIDFRNTQSLGMQLVITLAEQIEGNIELIKDNGSKFIITFPSTENIKQ